MLPVGVNIWVAGSYSSAVASGPPATNTVPELSRVALWPDRGILMVPVVGENVAGDRADETRTGTGTPGALRISASLTLSVMTTCPAVAGVPDRRPFESTPRLARPGTGTGVQMSGASPP